MNNVEKIEQGIYILNRMSVDSERTRIKMYKKYRSLEVKINHPDQSKIINWTDAIESFEAKHGEA